jgi:hypothetical protein
MKKMKAPFKIKYMAMRMALPFIVLSLGLFVCSIFIHNLFDDLDAYIN